jgi:hypothetical protein
MRLITLISALILLVCSPVFAANKYVRQYASGTGNGSDWTNAYQNLPGTLTRGDTYYVADGSYGAYVFNTPNSYATYITIKKATIIDHGTSTGWSDSYGDEQAVFTSLTLVTSYLIFDGAKRDESSWSTGSSYGFRLSYIFGDPDQTTVGDYITIKYCEIGGEYSATYGGGYPTTSDKGIEIRGWNNNATNWNIQRNFLHNIGADPNTQGSGVAIQLNGTTNFLIELNLFENIWGKETIRGQNRASNVIIRYNIIKNGGRSDCSGCTEGLTAEIGLFTNGSETPDFNGLEVYGNVIATTVAGGSSCCGTVMAEANAKVYNNTMINYSSPGNPGVGGVSLFNTAGSDVRNNIFYYPNGMTIACIAENCTNNSSYTSTPPPIVDIAGGNFYLTGALAGESLSSTWNTDLLGTTRGSDGVWDRGAYEYGGSVVHDTTPPYLYNASPSGTMACTSDPMTITESISSDEAATVRYSTTDQSYDDMSNTYSMTGGTSHSRTVSRACNSSYVIYNRGVDSSGNKNLTSTVTSYAISAYNPGTPQVTISSNYSYDVNSAGTKYYHDGDDWIGRGSSNALRTINRFSLSSVNSAWTITKVEYRVYVVSKTGSPGTLSVVRYGTSHGEDDSAGDVGATAYTKSAGTEYATLSEPSAGAWTSWIDLGATAISDLEWCGTGAATTWTVALKVSAGIEGGGTQAYIAISEDNDVTGAQLRITYTTEIPGGGAEVDFISGTKFGENNTATVKGVTTDTFIRVTDPDTAYGTSPDGYVRTTPADTAGRAILQKFDLTSIPTNATVTAASLYEYMMDGGGDSSLYISVHRVTGSAWTVNSTWSSYAFGSHIAAAETDNSFNYEVGWRSWVVTSMVTAWVADPSTNKGLVIATDQGANHAVVDTYRGFWLSDAADTNLRPILIVAYTVPDPATPGVSQTTFSFGSGTITLTPSGGSLTLTW